VLGSILGILPGGGAVIASFAAYTLEKKISKNSAEVRPRRDRRRRGAGKRQQCRAADLVHPAADARHSAERGDGADGRRDDHPRHRAGSAGDAEAAELVWGMIASMWVGNLMLLIINLPLVGIWVRCCACRIA
jgi:putative tricarboxylic transport membrane protein